jgi:Nucleotidyltransferase of unknown function (DUF6036)
MSDDLPSPWKEFLHELDALLPEQVTFHCVGGFAIVAAYGLLRSTNDLDYFTLEPSTLTKAVHDLAGEGSELARRHKVHAHNAAIASLPVNYGERLTELYPGTFKQIRLFVLDPCDLVLSKICRNAERDREDAKYLIKTQKINAAVLKERFDSELKCNLIGPPKLHEETLGFWIAEYCTH